MDQQRYAGPEVGTARSADPSPPSREHPRSSNQKRLLRVHACSRVLCPTHVRPSASQRAVVTFSALWLTPRCQWGTSRPCQCRPRLRPPRPTGIAGLEHCGGRANHHGEYVPRQGGNQPTGTAGGRAPWPGPIICPGGPNNPDSAVATIPDALAIGSGLPTRPTPTQAHPAWSAFRYH